MSDPSPSPSNQSRKRKKWQPLAGFFLILALAIIAAGILAYHLVKKGTSKSGNVPSVASIRSQFPTPSAAPTSLAMIRPSPAATPRPVANVHQSTHINFRGNGNWVSAANTNQNGSSSITVYSNSALGFSVSLNTQQWQAEQATANQVVITSRGGTSIHIEAYENFNDTLQTVEQQLQGSSSAINVHTTSFEGQPALQFQTSDGEQGVAVVYNNTLYYIIAPNLNSEPIATFRFLQ